MGVERKGHVSRFSQRARPGMPISVAEKNSTGAWVAAEGQPPGRVAWSRGNKICIVFDYPPSSSEQTSCFLLVPDSFTFEKMRSVLRGILSFKPALLDFQNLRKEVSIIACLLCSSFCH
jgi:hypothetical protein